MTARPSAALVARLEAEIEWLRAELARKDETMLALRREGFDPVSVQPDVPRMVQPRLDPVILAAIEAVAAPHEPLYGRLRASAERDLAAGIEPERIAAETRRGSTLNPFHA